MGISLYDPSSGSTKEFSDGTAMGLYNTVTGQYSDTGDSSGNWTVAAKPAATTSTTTSGGGLIGATANNAYSAQATGGLLSSPTTNTSGNSSTANLYNPETQGYQEYAIDNPKTMYNTVTGQYSETGDNTGNWVVVDDPVKKKKVTPLLQSGGGDYSAPTLGGYNTSLATAQKATAPNKLPSYLQTIGGVMNSGIINQQRNIAENKAAGKVGNASLAASAVDKMFFDNVVGIANAETQKNLTESGFEFDASKLNAQLGTTVSLENAKAINSNYQFATALQSENERFYAGLASQEKMQAADLALKKYITEYQGAIQTHLGESEMSNQLSIAAMDAATKKYGIDQDQNVRYSIASMDSGTRMLLADTAANSQAEVADSEFSRDLFKTLMTNVSQINLTKGLTPDAKKAQIDAQISIFNSGMQLLGKTESLGIEDILTPAQMEALDKEEEKTTTVTGGAGNDTVDAGRSD